MTQKPTLPAENYVLLASFGGALVGSDPRREAVGQLLDGHGHLYGYGVKQEATETLRKAGLMDGRGVITAAGLAAAERLLQGQPIPMKGTGAGPAVPVPDLGTVLGTVQALGKMAPHRFVVLKAYEASLHESHPDRARIAEMTTGQTVTDQEARFAVSSLQSSAIVDREGRLTEAGRSQARNILQRLI